MTELDFPFLQVSLLVPLVAALVLRWVEPADRARKWALAATGASLGLAVLTWCDFSWLQVVEAQDRWDFVEIFGGQAWLVIDRFNAPLLPLAALLVFLTVLATLRTKIHRISFSGLLLSESLLLATLSVRKPWLVILLLSLTVLPPYWELRRRGNSTRGFALHMSLHIGLMAIGWGIFSNSLNGSLASNLGLTLLVIGVLTRVGIFPLHGWVNDLFENATFAMALIFVVPMLGVYAALRLVLPYLAESIMDGLAVLALVTAVYAAGLSLVQRDVRRFFGCLFLSHSSLVVVGLVTITPIAVTGGLCVWLSVGVSLAGFGLTLRALESRMGRLSLYEYHGLYEHMPILAAMFLLTGLASVGFPGTIGFVAIDLLLEGVIHKHLLFGVAIVVTTAINSISILQSFFRLFTGKIHHSTVALQARPAERFSVLIVTFIVFAVGLVPQPFVSSRLDAAKYLLESWNKPSDDVP